MTKLRPLVDGFFRWIDSVAAAIVALFGWFSSPRAVQFVEDDTGTFLLRGGAREKSSDLPVAGVRIAEGRLIAAGAQSVETMLRGKRAELILKPERFLFRPLELPRRAAEFLDGIVRAQIDRLTPWNAHDAVFGWSKPAKAGTDRIAVTVAATARALVLPYVQAITAAGVESVVISTVFDAGEVGAIPIKVLDQKGRGALDLVRVRRVLLAVLLVAGGAAATGLAAGAVIGPRLEAQQDALARQITSRRSAALAGREQSLDANTAALRMLERRKHELPASVIVLDRLSEILPDHTYVTELRIEGDKLRMVGITRDAPSLIGLIERGSHFTRATFFAPTTRSPTDSGERFHIEARIEPNLLPRS